MLGPEHSLGIPVITLVGGSVGGIFQLQWMGPPRRFPECWYEIKWVFRPDTEARHVPHVLQVQSKA